MKLFGAIDLHSNNNVTVLINEKDEVVYRKRLPNDLKLILGQLAPHQSKIEGIVVESTYNWYWLVDGLMERGHRVHLANTAAIEQYSGLKYTDDDSDARWLAHLLRLGVLPQLSERTTARTRSVTQAQPTGQIQDSQSVEHSKSVYPQYRQFDERQPDQRTPSGGYRWYRAGQRSRLSDQGQPVSDAQCRRTGPGSRTDRHRTGET